MDVFRFDERLYTLDVEKVPQYEVPKITDPNEGPSDETVLCYEPTKLQVIQLAVMIWQVATRERNKLKTRTPQFMVAEQRVTTTRELLKSLLLPFVEGDRSKAQDLCITLLSHHKDALNAHLANWSILKRPDDVWVDEKSNRIFIAKHGDRVVVGLNPTDYVFVYNDPSK